MSSRDKADARFGAFSEVRHIQMGASILERGIRPLPTIPQFAGAKSGIPANGLYPALLLNCHSALPSCLMFGPKPWVTLITPTSALFSLPGLTQGRYDSFPMPRVTPPSSCLLIPSLTRSHPHRAGPVLITEQKRYPGMALSGAVWWVGNNQAYCHLDAWLLKIWDCGLSESQ